MKASDNPYPSILLDEVAEPASPTAGSQRLYLDPADHQLKVKQSDGTVSGVGGGGLTVQDENANVATNVTQIDFQGAGVTATAGTGEVVVTIPGGGGGGGVGVGDFALWTRTAQPKDSTSNTLNYTTDLSGSSGTSITVDSSTGWISAWSSPAPVLVAGLYVITLSFYTPVQSNTGVALYDATGSSFAYDTSVFVSGNYLDVVATDVSNAHDGTSWGGSGSTTVLVPDNTHLDLSNYSGTANNQYRLWVQKIG